MKVESKLTGLEWNLDRTFGKHRAAGVDYSLYIPATGTKKAAYMGVTSRKLIDDFTPVAVPIEGTHPNNVKYTAGEALYGIISAMGDTWTVVFRKVHESENAFERWKTCEHSGCGEFPFDRYPGIPVVDFTDSDGVYPVFRRDIMVDEAGWDHTGLGIWKYIPLLSYLDQCIMAGVTVYGLTHDKMTYYDRQRKRKRESCQTAES